jgi:hypothetical protein
MDVWRQVLENWIALNVVLRVFDVVVVHFVESAVLPGVKGPFHQN